MEDLIAQLDNPPGDSLQHPSHELLGLDKELRSIRSSIKVETVKKVELEEHIERENCKLSKIRDNPDMMMVFEKTSGTGSKGKITN